MLAKQLATVFQHRIARRAGAGVLVAELRTLATGERDFLLWTTPEFTDLFAPWPELSVTGRSLDDGPPERGHEATFIQWARDDSSAVIDPEVLTRELWALLPRKRETILTELESLRATDARTEAAYWRERRVAFLCASLAWIARAEWRH